MTIVHPPTLPTLYHATLSCSSIPHMALLELNVPSTKLSVVTVSEYTVTRDPEYAKISPRQVVPVFALPDADIIVESGAILLHILETFDTTNKLHPAPGSPLRAKFLQHVMYVAAEALKAIVAVFVICRTTPAEERDRSVLDPLLEKYNNVVVKYLERELDYGKRPFLLGDDFSAADIAFAYVIATAWQCEGSGEATLDNEIVKKYQQRLAERSSYTKLYDMSELATSL